MIETTCQPIAQLRLNDLAPDFAARSTCGPITLSSYRGRWVLLFAHPANFTPVCTSEFIAIARASPDFEKLDCALLGLSVDSLYSHIAWIRDIRERFGINVAFPLIEDPSMEIAKAYGMIDGTSDSSATVRATYVIDPEGIIRAIVWYPMNVGRSVHESLRLVSALQSAQRENASTPEGWLPGNPLLEHAPTSDRYEGELAPGESWYYRERRT
ncbi:peroxiredoxin [Ensifer adhaerens]|uniref:peroxiredoxin n=1 Tax=Ensifer adhaerens TaxID=106592 RepID=UPI000DC29233|nr:peroxiredoxin [Ensifer adhaerens]RAS08277.1 peroxiredoxin (alkyl hydroperoxide reductase subunit C) [Ensifer adhaerens]